MSGEEGWLMRVTRRLGDIVGGTGEDTSRASDGASRTAEDDALSFPLHGAAAHGDQTAGGMRGHHPDRVPPNTGTSIRRDGNGRYSVAGWTFSTLKQALEFEADRSNAAGPPRATPAAHDLRNADKGHNASSAIRVDDAGRFTVGGWTFSTLEQALEFEEARRSAADHLAPTAPPGPAAPIREAAYGSGTVPHVPPSEPGSVTEGRERPRWVTNREALSAGGMTFEVEMVYFGTPLRHDPRHDHSRIDPKLPVDARGDPSGASSGYWPCYRDMSPRARASYLGWLSAGRQATPVATGYLFLFFYGLEQRLLIDDARTEAPAIFAELRRLMALHAEDFTFQSYAEKLLALRALYDDEDASPLTVECACNWEPELPLDLRIRLGGRLRDEKPFDADDALRWVLAMPDVHLRTPGQRCFAELLDLWRLRFVQRYQGGLLIRRPKKTVRYEYRAASGKFSVDLSIDDLPDVSGISAPLAPLRAMLALCLDDLSAFSRLVGRDPDARGSVHAELLLPPDLRIAYPALRTVRDRLAAASVGNRSGVLSVAELAPLIDIVLDPSVERLPGAAGRRLAMTLDALDYGFEPDLRYGPSSGLRPETCIAIFPSSGGGAVNHERPAYVAARTMTEIATLVAAADGEVVAAEIKVIERRLRALPDLANEDVARLMAVSRALAADPPKVRAALKRLADVPPEQRAAIAASAVEAALADGIVQPEEVKFLEALHTALELPASGLYSALHRAIEDVGPVTVDPGRRESGVPIPATSERSAVTIDMARIERIRGETDRVSALLATIFVEEGWEANVSAPAPIARPAIPVTSVASEFDGLDAAHSELLRRLIAAPMARGLFDATANELRLMPDGAIETINEWGFDCLGEPALDEDDGVRVVPEVRRMLDTIGVAS